jgi:RHS repeat-associated protein
VYDEKAEPSTTTSGTTITRPSDNAIVWRWESDPFGSTAANENPSGLGAFSYHLRFPGQYYDSETGLHYNYFRDYDPATGRYIESDPIGLRGGINTYAYVRSAPTMIIDPTGLSFADYFSCMYHNARFGGASDCRDELFASATADARREFERMCEAVGEFVECVTICALQNFVGASFTEAVVNAHKQVAIHTLNKIAKETANKYARRFLPIVGQVDFINDSIGTIRCTTNCVKR